MGKNIGKYSPSLLQQVIPSDSGRREVTELHVHLGGAVPLYRLWEMGMERGIRGVAHSYTEFIELLTRAPSEVKNLDDYLAIFDMVELIQAGPHAVAESIRIAINGAYRTGGMRRLGPGGEGGDPYPVFAITQLELRFNPMKRTGTILSKGGVSGLYDVDRIIKAACESIEESEIAYRGELCAGLNICFARDLPWDVNRTLAEKVNHWRKQHKKLIGIDLAGPESTRSLADPADLEQMAELYDLAAGEELGRTVHCGETPHVDLNTFIATIKALRPHRVAHPVVAARSFWEDKDARGLELLAEKGIICELCIRSNILTRAVSTAQEYGRFLNTLDEFKIPYTFSTDSPALQLSTLASELEFLLTEKAVSPDQLIRAFETADTSTFLHRRSGIN